MQLLKEFYADSFETLQVFWPCSYNEHVVWIQSSDNFCNFIFTSGKSHLPGVIPIRINR